MERYRHPSYQERLAMENVKKAARDKKEFWDNVKEFFISVAILAAILTVMLYMASPKK